MGLDAEEAAVALTPRESVLEAFAAYESHFAGNILDEEGCACVASWPGIYAKLW